MGPWPPVRSGRTPPASAGAADGAACAGARMPSPSTGAPTVVSEADAPPLAHAATVSAATAARMSSEARSGVLRRRGSPMVVHLRWARSPRPEPPLVRRLGDATDARPVPRADAAPGTRSARSGLSRNAGPGLPAGSAARYRAAMRLPFAPPVEPMLAKARRRACPRATAGCSSPSGTASAPSSSATATSSYIQSRDLKPLDRYFPELAAPLRAQLPERCVLDGEVVIAGDGGLAVRGAAAAHPPGRVAGEDAGRGDAGVASSPGTCSRSATRTSAAVPQGERRARLEAGARAARRAAGPPDARDARPRAGRGLVRPVRGRRPRRRRREAARRRRTSPASGRCSRSSTSAPPTAWWPGSAGTRTARARTSASLLLGPVRRRGHAPPRRASRRRSRGTGARRSSAELAPLREDALDGHPWARVGRVGGGRRRGRVRPAAARRDVALEPRQGPVVGAAPRRAGRRGRLRPPPGRPVPPRARRSSAGARTSRPRTAATTSSRRPRPYELARIFGGD